MLNLSCIDSNTLLIIVALISIVASDDLTAEELGTAGGVLTAIADLFAVKAGQLEAQSNNEELKNQINDMEQQLAKLKKQIR